MGERLLEIPQCATRVCAYDVCTSAEVDGGANPLERNPGRQFLARFGDHFHAPVAATCDTRRCRR